LPVEHHDLMPGLGKIIGGGNPDYAAPENRDLHNDLTPLLVPDRNRGRIPFARGSLFPFIKPYQPIEGQGGALPKINKLSVS
jgi:hypothetical protein